jgi:hypothetical protein
VHGQGLDSSKRLTGSSSASENSRKRSIHVLHVRASHHATQCRSQLSSLWLHGADVYCVRENVDQILRRHLNVLGLPAATALESPAVRQAYLQSAREWHAGPGKSAAEEKFKGIQHAYHTLCTYLRTKRLPEDE